MENEKTIGRGERKLSREVIKLERAFRSEVDAIVDYVESLVDDPEQPMGIEVILETIGKEEPFVDLRPEEQGVLLKVIKEKLGVDFGGEPTRTYTWEGPEGEPGAGEARVSVFSTNREGLAVHKILYTDGKVSFAFGLL